MIHRVWVIGTLSLLLLLTIQLTLSGFLRPRHIITETAELKPEHSEPGRKVLFILYDALREDYIEWPNDKMPNLDPNASYAYKGRKVELFKRLIEEQPLNSFL